jgi:photosystem II stability/assembly factor-like uncharacterized protein
LELHAQKTRLIEFGRHAEKDRQSRGEGKPETFNFLGFTHSCAKTRKGKFTVLRQTMRTRWQAKLRGIKAELRRRMHEPVPEMGAYVVHDSIIPIFQHSIPHLRRPLMAKNFTICVGTLGMGLWRSPDGGMSWARGKLWKGYQGGRSVFGLAVHPKDPRVIYAGADDGIHPSEDRGANFEHIDSPLDGYKVWRIAIDPAEPNTMFAGTAPPALFRSRDGGLHWEKLTADFSTECLTVTTPRVTALVVDPLDHKFVWAGVEVDGVRVSRDGGDTWTRPSGGLMDEPDIHDIKPLPGKPGAAVVTLPDEICVSTDGGMNWQALGVRGKFPLPYCRSITFKPDDMKVILAAIGDDALGGCGSIQRSSDGAHVGNAAAAHRTKHSHGVLRDPPRRSRSDSSMQPLWAALRQLRRRRVVG